MKLFPFRTVSQTLFIALALTSTSASAAEAPPALRPAELIRRAVENEIKSNDQPAKYMFRQRKETPEGSQTRLLVETREAMAGMVIAYNDRPLNPEQRQGEYGRIQRFIDNPAELDRKRQKEKEDSDRVQSILKALPDAFLYEYDGTETGRPGVGKPGDELLRLKFRHNPKYDPPTRVEQVLTGMEGVVLIDAQKLHIARIDGTLFKDVGFGWGILGHLDRGGHFQVDQTDVDADHWSISRMVLAFTGKILMLKNLNIKSTAIYSDFQSVPPNLSFAQGVDLLKKQLATVGESQARNTSGK